jgi:hypothetical protein
VQSQTDRTLLKAESVETYDPVENIPTTVNSGFAVLLEYVLRQPLQGVHCRISELVKNGLLLQVDSIIVFFGFPAWSG